MDYLEVKKLFDKSNLFYIITTNMEGKYSYINSRYRTVFGGIHGEIVGQPYHITMHPNDTLICQSVSEQCFAHPDQVFPATIRKYDGRGGYIITQWEYKAIISDQNKPEGIFCFGYDITAFENTSKQLDHALHALDRQEEVLTDIAYNQSHIIRKPVANILGLGLVLDHMSVEPNVKNLVNLLIESAHELDVAIKNIVDKANS